MLLKLLMFVTLFDIKAKHGMMYLKLSKVNITLLLEEEELFQLPVDGYKEVDCLSLLENMALELIMSLIFVLCYRMEQL